MTNNCLICIDKGIFLGGKTQGSMRLPGAVITRSSVDPRKFYVKNSPSSDLDKCVSEFELKANDEKDLEKWR